MRAIMSKLLNLRKFEILLILLMGAIAATLIKLTYTFVVKPGDTLTSSVLKAIILVYVLGCLELTVRAVPKTYKPLASKNKIIWNIKHLGMLFALTAFYLFLFMTPIFIAGYYYFKR